MALRDTAVALRTMRSARIIRPINPRRLFGAGQALRYWGVNYAGGFAASAARNPDRVCIHDERHRMTWAELDRRSNAVANGLARRGVGQGDVVGLLCRNHGGFVLATAALAKLGATLLYLNTGFAGPQLREVLEREGAVALIHDDEYTSLVGRDAPVATTVVAWPDDDAEDRLTLDELANTATAAAPPSPSKPGRVIILTSGTTGTPKGAPRDQSTSTGVAVGMLERIPYRDGDVTVLAAPLFHSWGLANMSLSLLLSSTMVLRRRFDPEQTLADIERNRARVLVAVPVMLQRILELGPEVHSRYDTSSLEVVSLSGSSIPGTLATQWMDTFGDNIYNLYGSTEVGWATIATPEDLRADPATAGRPPLHTAVRVLDENGTEVPPGQPGRIFVGSELNFEGYTSGGGKEVIDGLMSTGDTGHFDAEGRLYVDGRDDEMIVSGGENVFPREIEELLATHPEIVEAAAVGVDDEEFGQRLKVAVVARSEGSLSEDDVRGFVRDNLARYKVPRDVVFLEELPRNTTGKVLKRELR